MYYVYLIHESPIEPPYYCKVGYTDNPVRRLAALQAGNPRALRSIDYQRRPTKPFGFGLPTKEHAVRFEREVHVKLESMGLRHRQDFNYETNTASAREWFSGLHPDKLWALMAEIYYHYLKAHSLSVF